MLSPKENYLIAARGGKPERVPSFVEDTNVLENFIWGPDPKTHIDWYGVKWLAEVDGIMPDVHHVAMTDITQWRDIVQWPDLTAVDWEAKAAEFHASPTYDPNKADVWFVGNGIFLTPINMMGWVEGMCAMLEEPEEFKALVDAETDFHCEYIHYLGKYYHPDILTSGDDICAAGGPFFGKEEWDYFFKEPFTRICDAIHEAGALAEFHDCGDCQWTLDETIACGFDIMQLPVPNKTLEEQKARYGNRLVLTGGWVRHGPAGVAGAPEEVVRQSVRDAIDTYGRDGAFIFWDGGIILNNDANRQKMEWLLDELHSYGAEVYR